MKKTNKVIKIIFLPCTLYLFVFLLNQIFAFIGSLKLGLFSEILKFASVILSIPISKLDLIIIGYNIEPIVLLLGLIYPIYIIYDNL